MPTQESKAHITSGLPAVIYSIQGIKNDSHKAIIDYEDASTVSCIGGSEPTDSPAADGITRKKWSRSIEFLLSCVALSVGFGNVWRFPAIAMQNGGGAFVIPYLIVLFVVGKPLYYLEMVIGQFSSRGCVKVYDVCPLLRGIGVGQTIVMFTIMGYYAAILAVAVRYFVAAFESPLPWSTCQDEWNASCISSNWTGTLVNVSTETMSSAHLYLFNTILHKVPDLTNGIGLPDWKLALCLLVCWICITSMLIKGIKTSGKASYVLAIFPYVILFILLIRTCTLDGAMKGIKQFFEPDWEKLFEVKVWYEAVTQCFFSLTIGLGAVIVFSSFNSFSQNIYRDAMIISWLDTFTSLLSGVIVFGVAGNISHITKRNVTEIIKNPGPEVVFVTYPDAIAKMDYAANIFAVLFFLMFVLLGMGSITGVVTTVMTSIKDRFPKVQTWKVVPIIAILAYCIGLVYITPGGFHVMNVVEFYGVTYAALTLIILEVITFCWIYGVNRLCVDIRFMLGIETGIYWRVCWGFLTLFIIVTIFVAQTVLKNGVNAPVGYHVFGWCLYAFIVLQVVGWAAYALSGQPENQFRSKISHALRSVKDWGPESAVLKKDYDVAVQRYKDATGGCRNVIRRVYRKLFQ